MKSASLGAVATLVFCSWVTSSATAKSSTDFSNHEGKLAGTIAGLSLSGSTLIGANDNSSDGVPASVLYSGAFSGPVTWTLITLANRTHNHSVTGVVVGTTAKAINAVAVQSATNAGKKLFQNSSITALADTTFAGGNTTSISSVPEPSTFPLLLAGSVATALGLMRRKLLGTAREAREK